MFFICWTAYQQACGSGYGNEIAWLTIAESAAGQAISHVKNSKSKLAASVNTDAAAQLLAVRLLE